MISQKKNIVVSMFIYFCHSFPHFFRMLCFEFLVIHLPLVSIHATLEVASPEGEEEEGWTGVIKLPIWGDPNHANSLQQSIVWVGNINDPCWR